HEEQVGRILADRLPGTPVALSSRLLRRHMEYERANTTVASVYCSSRLGRYLNELSDGLHARQIRAPLSVMSSAGGFLSGASARDAPVQLVESGPSAGATYVAELARRLDRADVLAFDMGGTTAKACLIREGRLPMTTEVEAARAESYRIGSGIPLQVTAVNLIEVGAGGGSIATIDSVGLVRVGPRSAGARPGPACYLRGGTSATVTDADLVLGHLAPHSFLGGQMRLGVAEAQAALTALASDVADAVEMARVVQEVVTENMSAAVLRHVIERGGDPERLTLVAFGGAGPVHAYALAKRLGIKEFLVPPLAGVLSAVGLLTAQPTFRSSRTVKLDLRDVDVGRLATPVSELRDEIGAALRTVDAVAAPEFSVYADCAYAGQSSVLSVPVTDPDTADGDSIAADFAAAYQSTYGYSQADVRVEVVTVTAEGRLPVAQPELPRDARGAVRPDGTRRAWSHVRGRFEDFAVRWRTSLRPGERVDGPVIIEETESTTVVDVDGSALLDDVGNLRIEVPTGVPS
ncbi:MAG TPA: hydantoinase/oxoprolinase family protein, partial [Micromonosporaceae bacterium]